MQVSLINKKAFIRMDQYRWESNVVGTCNDVWMMLLPSHSKHEWGEVTSGSGVVRAHSVSVGEGLWPHRRDAHAPPRPRVNSPQVGTLQGQPCATHMRDNGSFPSSLRLFKWYRFLI